MASEIKSLATIANAEGYTTLQNMIWPDPVLCTEADLYLHLDRAAGISHGKPGVDFGIGGKAGFGSYFNLFNIGKWAKHCALEDLSLRIQGEGRFEISVFFAIPDRSWERIHRQVHDLSETAPLRIDLSHYSNISTRGILYFEVKALSSGHISDAVWQTKQTPKRHPNLVLSITTFKREDAVRNTAQRFADYLETSPLRDFMHLIVVDNGHSADITPTPAITTVLNENLGGAGGFARGLIEALKRNATHCLFMDDDAAIHMESLHRTWIFLAFATDPSTTISGALANAAHRWAVWENGAVFNKRCRPLYNGTDLRNLNQVFRMEIETTKDRPKGFYGGWWFFAFPLDQVDHMPFPFFVRGDDISFSLVHDFNIVTLPGVISFQDVDFADKQSAQTLYLDLRSHLAHHLALPDMEIGRIEALKLVLSFFAKALASSHYGTARALNLAFEDAMEGPEFFAKNADMSERRLAIKALMQDEVWQDYKGDPPAARININPHNTFLRRFIQLSLNGALLPFFTRFGNKVVVDADGRDHISNSWATAEMFVYDSTKKKAYCVRHSKRAFFGVSLRLLRNCARFMLRYPNIRTAWRSGYNDLTKGDFWDKRLKT